MGRPLTDAATKRPHELHPQVDGAAGVSATSSEDSTSSHLGLLSPPPPPRAVNPKNWCAPNRAPPPPRAVNPKDWWAPNRAAPPPPLRAVNSSRCHWTAGRDSIAPAAGNKHPHNQALLVRMVRLTGLFS